MKKISNFSCAALALSAFILLISVLTLVIDTPTFINRIHTTIIFWQLPLVTIGLLVCAFLKEKDCELLGKLRLAAIGALVVGFFCTNLTKNIVQDVVSNAENYVDVAVATMDSEAENVVEYGVKLETARKAAEKKINAAYAKQHEEEIRRAIEQEVRREYERRGSQTATECARPKVSYDYEY
jgi:uncharacterized membrane protein